MSKTSINNNLVLKPYTKTRELETTQAATGFAMTKNKVGMESLELLVDAIVNLGYDSQRHLAAGSKIFFKEETLYVQPWARKVFESEQFPEGFIIADLKDVVFIEEEY